MSDLAWVCDGCGRPGGGALVVAYEDIRVADDARRAVSDHSGEPTVIAKLRADTAAATVDSRARWRVWHRECNPEPDGGGYEIPLGRVRTEADLLRWTAHLFRKTWFASTDWDQLIADVVGRLP